MFLEHIKIPAAMTSGTGSITGSYMCVMYEGGKSLCHHLSTYTKHYNALPPAYQRSECTYFGNDWIEMC